MRVLLSAFACSPEWGSEPGVGWHWAVELARDNEVTVLTHQYFAKHIEPALARIEGPRPRVEYVDVALPIHPHRLLNSRTYYCMWQWRAATVARRLVMERQIQLVHHITWGTFRFPSFMGGLGVPFVFGPLGGGEKAPGRLTRSLPWKPQLIEAVRRWLIRVGKVDPLVRATARGADLILCKTSETRDALPLFAQSKARLLMEIGADSQRIVDAPRAGPSTGTIKLLFAGRLIAVKGIHLAIMCIAQLRRSGLDVRLDIAGDGALKPHLVALAGSLAVADRVNFLGGLSRQQLMMRYQEADCFLFPSLHDSSGNVVLEALSSALPVVCLDLGGPKHFVDASCGAVVSTVDADESEVALRLANAVKNLVSDREHYRKLSAAALERARTSTWERRVKDCYHALAREFRIISQH